MNLSLLIDAISNTKLEALSPLLQKSAIDGITRGDFARWRGLLAKIPKIKASSYEFNDIVKIGSEKDIDSTISANLRKFLREMVPWRKGPFRVFGIDIDSEWRCQMKWQRLQHHITPLRGRKVLDVGSGNGYYSFRMLQDNADLVVGLDPHIPYVVQFWVLKGFLPNTANFVLPYSLEQLPSSLHGFDTVFSMGVIYHRRSPIEHLMQLKHCMAPGGELVLETLFVEGPTGYSLTPEKKYARIANVWFLPTLGTLESWLMRCGFKDIRVINTNSTNQAEQRKTEWMPFESLEDGINSRDNLHTIEGYPAPNRAIILASHIS